MYVIEFYLLKLASINIKIWRGTKFLTNQKKLYGRTYQNIFFHTAIVNRNDRSALILSDNNSIWNQ